MREELKYQHEAQIHVQLIDQRLRFLLQSLLLFFVINFSNICPSCLTHLLLTLLFKVYFFHCLCIPVSELNDAWYYGDYDEEVEDPDEGQDGLAGYELDIPVEDYLEMLFVILSGQSQFIVVDSFRLSQYQMGNIKHQIDSQSQAKTVFFAVISQEKSVDSQLNSVDQNKRQCIEGDQRFTSSEEAHQVSDGYKNDQPS